MSAVLVVLEHDRGILAEASLEAITFGRRLADDLDADLEAVVIGDGDFLEAIAPYRVDRARIVHHDLLTDYAPEAWGESVAQLVSSMDAEAVLAGGTDRGNEVIAQVAARADLPMAANCLEVEVGEEWRLVRVRWGGSLLEEAALSAPVKLITVAPHSVQAEPVDGSEEMPTETFTPELEGGLARTRITERSTQEEGVTLATAPVVVSGGRGVGSPEGFEILEQLAELLGGAVGCSRVATNNGWRPHSDQVGQTGTRVAPDLYIACGISGAIQHWVGCMGSKNILALNIDPEAPMMTKADYAVLGDLHEVLPAVIEEVRRRQNGG